MTQPDLLQGIKLTPKESALIPIVEPLVKLRGAAVNQFNTFMDF